VARYPALLLGSLLVILAASAVAPYDRATWLMEVMPVLIVVPVLIATRHRFALSAFLYTCIFLHCLVLILGGYYTYARVPLGFWAEQAFHLSRNDYDKLGHFVQGFVPALAAREILLRNGFVRGRRIAAFLCVCVAMFVSANYEIIEWLAAVAMGQGAEAFLGTQGDTWDTQTDMASALIGACVAMLLFTAWQDRSIAALRR
jgi:putative membrane protein